MPKRRFIKVSSTILLFFLHFVDPVHSVEIATGFLLPSVDERSSLSIAWLGLDAADLVQVDRLELFADGLDWKHASLTSLSLSPAFLDFGVAFAELSEGTGEPEWDKVSDTALWFGFRHSIGELRAAVSVNVVQPFMVRVRPSNAEILDAELSAQGFTINSWFRDFFVFFGAEAFSGELTYQEARSVGDFNLASFLCVTGTRRAGAFYLQAGGEAAASFSILNGWMYFAKGKSSIQGGGGWIAPEFSSTNWTASLLSIFGLFNVGDAYYRSYRQWLNLPSFTTRQEESVSRFTEDQAWLLILHPSLSWRPSDNLTLDISRWIPFASGWEIKSEILSGPNVGTTLHTRTPRLSTDTDWHTLLLAGSELTLRWSF